MHCDGCPVWTEVGLQVTDTEVMVGVREVMPAPITPPHVARNSVVVRRKVAMMANLKTRPKYPTVDVNMRGSLG